MKITAKQVPWEEQRSPMDDISVTEWYPDIIIDGNRDLGGYKTEEYKRIKEYYTDIIEDIENYFIKEYGKDFKNFDAKYLLFTDEELKDILEIFNGYGLLKNKDIKTIKKLMPIIINNYDEIRHRYKEEEIIIAFLSAEMGCKYERDTICGSFQRDWQYIYYPIDEYSKKSIRQIEMEYFNTGSEWFIYEEEEMLFSMYCYSWQAEDIKDEIAAEVGEPVENIDFQKFTGYTQVATYAAI